MYSGSTLTPYSGRILGAHQKIDRTARQHLAHLLHKGTPFPATRAILHFEGHNGPDSIKRKSPAVDEPWHYFNPFDKNDTLLLNLIKDHYTQLVQALKTGNETRAAFEAAWLAHAIVDGLTPAHHYPYEAKLSELRGQGKETRTTIKEKLVIPGETPTRQVRNNWRMWGPKGLFTTHAAFEWGVATLIAPLRLHSARPAKEELQAIITLGPIEWFTRNAKEIAALDLYESFYKNGWTTRLARIVRKQLAPRLVQTVTLLWYSAAYEAGLTQESV